MSTKKHQWKNEEIKEVLTTTIFALANTDEQEANIIMADTIGVTKGSISALRTSLRRISLGFEATPLSGGPGFNYGQNVKIAFDEWFEEHAQFTKRNLSNKL